MYYIIVNKCVLKRKSNVKKLTSVKTVFDSSGIEYTVRLSESKESARTIAAEITSGSGNSVIVMGGDGTLHDVLNGFVNFENNRLGLIPLGTGNDFAKAAGIPVNVKKAAEIIVADKTRKIDFIELNSGLRSINAVGAGIDVDVLKRAYAGKNTKKSKYLFALISSLIHFESYEYTVEYDGVEEKHFGLIGAVGNGKQIGGGIKVFPEAEIDDGYLDLLVVDYISKIKIIGAFIRLMLGKINAIKQVTAVKTKAVKFIPRKSYTIQADGELYDDTPLEAHICEGKLNFYMK